MLSRQPLKRLHFFFGQRKPMANPFNVNYWFTALRDATPEQRNNWRFVGNGEGIHWKDLDEDILVEGLLQKPLVIIPDIGFRLHVDHCY